MNTVKLCLLKNNLDKLKILTDTDMYKWNDYFILSEKKEKGSKYTYVELQYKDLDILVTHLLII